MFGPPWRPQKKAAMEVGAPAHWSRAFKKDMLGSISPPVPISPAGYAPRRSVESAEATVAASDRPTIRMALAIVRVLFLVFICLSPFGCHVIATLHQFLLSCSRLTPPARELAGIHTAALLPLSVSA